MKIKCTPDTDNRHMYFRCSNNGDYEYTNIRAFGNETDMAMHMAVLRECFDDVVFHGGTLPSWRLYDLA